MKGGQWLSTMQAALPEHLAGPYGEALNHTPGGRHPPMPARLCA